MKNPAPLGFTDGDFTPHGAFATVLYQVKEKGKKKT